MTLAARFTQLSLSATGTSAALVSLTLCPSVLSIENPSPVEPVSGRESPPVARINFFAITSRPFLRIAFVIRPPSFSSRATGELDNTVTPLSFKYFTSTSHTERAESETGNTLCSASIFVGIPRVLKKCTEFSLFHCEKGEGRNLPPRLNLASSLRVSGSAFVTLHRPPPVMRIFLPSDAFFSISTTFAPSSAARPAAIMPAGPPPITATSQVVSESFIVGILTLKKESARRFRRAFRWSTKSINLPKVNPIIGRDIDFDFVSLGEPCFDVRLGVVEWLTIHPDLEQLLAIPILHLIS